MEPYRTPARLLRAGAVVLAAAPLAMCAPAAPVVLTSPAPSAPSAPVTLASADAAPRRGALTDHVVVISIDGLRPDAIGRFHARTLERLMREGSASLQARTILPSKTLPSHTSMLTGMGPEAHHITWNENELDAHGTVAVPTIFAGARRAGLVTAAFFSKGKFNHLLVPGTLDYATAPEGDGRWYAGRTVENVERYLAGGARPNLMFVHVGDPDFAGHVAGWMSSLYASGVRRADEAVARVAAAADRAFGRGRWALIVTADHGGHGLRHGSSDPRDVTIPWIAWGQGVREGAALPEGIHTTDTAATALRLLGVAEDAEGVPVAAALETGRPSVAVMGGGSH
jgi:predicted AlkP superfamily pyrophosphatase or phosphodiesterase